MKIKKFLRQQAQREQREIEERKQKEANRQTVILSKDNSLVGNYRWNCPNHEGTFSWSKQINAQWGHPDDKAFCAVCFTYHNIKFEDKAV